jgi:hypothetical protein
MPVVPCDPENLSLSDHLHRFDSLNYCPRRLLRPRSLHRAQTTLDVAVIRFDPVVPVLATLMTAGRADLAFGLQFADAAG